MSVSSRAGFTLIELLVAIAIIGILAAIAIPAYLGQREKAKGVVIEDSARAVATELHSQLDSFMYNRPIIVSMHVGAKTCIESAMASDNSTCKSIFPDMGVSGTYSGIEDIVNLMIRHYNVGMDIVSPYDGAPMFTNTPENGHVMIVNSTQSALWLVAYSNNGVVLYNAPINSR